MRILDFLGLGKKQAVKGQPLFSASNDEEKQAAAAVGLRIGMWVATVDSSRPGILTSVNPEGIATVMLTQDDGTNLAEIHTTVGNLRQAAHLEIPAGRRPHPDISSFFGYK